ncbi:MAG: hypothetical protein M3169_10510 [Candidatus Eremiobacteraeota bacterium]|nr:hypothetical protein [Candidatus Eremiobacteraeota bacterium]
MVRRLLTVTVALFTVTVNCADPPCGLETVIVHVPVFWGVTVAVNVFPFCDGFATATSALLPVPQAALGVTVSELVGTFTVMVTFCANALPVPENVSELGLRLSCPAGPWLPVGNGGGSAPPP